MLTQWTITRDLLAEDDPRPARRGTNANAVGIVGPRGATLTSEQIIAEPGSLMFRLYDDDGGALCYEGWLIGGDEFAPLDQFGQPNAGCTSIKVLVNGDQWVQV